MNGVSSACPHCTPRCPHGYPADQHPVDGPWSTGGVSNPPPTYRFEVTTNVDTSEPVRWTFAEPYDPHAPVFIYPHTSALRVQ